MKSVKMRYEGEYDPCYIEIDGTEYACERISGGVESIVYRVVGTNYVFKRLYCYIPQMIEVAERLDSKQDILRPKNILIPEATVFNDENQSLAGWLFEYIDVDKSLNDISSEHSADFDALAYYYISLVQIQTLLDNGINLTDTSQYNWVITKECIQYLIDTVTGFINLQGRILFIKNPRFKEYVRKANISFLEPTIDYLYSCLLKSGELKRPERIPEYEARKIICFDYFGLKVPTDIDTLRERILDIIGQLNQSVKDEDYKILATNGIILG